MVGTARCAVSAPSGRNVFRRLYRRGIPQCGTARCPYLVQTARRAVPTGFRTDTLNGKSKTPDVVSYSPQAVGVEVARHRCYLQYATPINREQVDDLRAISHMVWRVNRIS